MSYASSRATVSDQFAELFREVEQSETYYIEAAKVELSEQIYAAMERGHVSQAELARRLGKSRAYVNKVLQGNVNFTVESLLKIGRALGCDFEFRFAPQRAEAAGVDLAEAWQKNLRAVAFTRIGMKQRYMYDTRLAVSSPTTERKNKHETFTAATRRLLSDGTELQGAA